MYRSKKLLLSSAILTILLVLCTNMVSAAGSKTGKVTASSLKLRTGPGFSYSVVGSLPKGNQVSILSESGKWYKIKTSSGKTAWVYKSYISLGAVSTSKESSTNFSKSKTGVVTASSLNLRKGPGLSYAIAGSVLRGKKVTLLGVKSNWYKMKTSSGSIAWGYKDYISLNTSSVSRGETLSRKEAALSTDQGMVSYAKRFLGVKYVWGGSSPSGFDCSGFVKYVYNHFGKSLERVASSQATQGVKVSRDSLQTGDLVFFDTNGGHNYINHVGMYIGNGEFIHASSGRGRVIITSLSDGFYSNHYMTARRIG